MGSQELRIFENADAVAEQAAADLKLFILDVLSRQDELNLAVTGGTVGIKTLAEFSKVVDDSIDLNRLNIWWGDERYVPLDDSDRNSHQAEQVLLANLNIPATNIHLFPVPGAQEHIQDAAAKFGQEFDKRNISFDLMIMGMGPDGHIASLFPGKSSLTSESSVIAEVDSPKPPKQRLTFGLRVINESKNIWFTVAGFDKADAVSEVISNPLCDLPAAKISGKEETVWYLDQTASSKL